MWLLDMIAWVLIIGYFTASITFPFYEAQKKSDHNLAHNLGRASGYLSLLARNPSLGVVAFIAVLILDIVLASIPVEADKDRSPDNRPPIAPIQAANLRMPTTYPFERRRTVAPPFIGHRFALGGDRS